MGRLGGHIMIISKRHARKLVLEGKAKIEMTLKPDSQGRVYVAITRYDIQRTDHYLDRSGQL